MFGQKMGHGLAKRSILQELRPMDHLEDAAAAYRAAVAELDAARAAVPVKRLEKRRTREALVREMIKEARKGTSQKDIVRRSGYTRERVRQIFRAAGIEPDDE